MRNLFIVLVLILLVLVLLYFYERREVFINKEYSGNHYYIEYPYFGDDYIDSYIGNYLDGYINNNNDYLFIDYDYVMKNNKMFLSMYIYGENDGIANYVENNYIIDVLKRSVIKGKNNDVYDVYYNKIIRNSDKYIALTFDDGPNYNTNKILDILEKYGVKATFFVLGCNIRGNEKILKRMNNMGMEIGNHMYSHKLVSRLSNDKIMYEIDRVDDLVYDTIYKYPTLIRPSYGSYNKKFSSIVDRPIITWNVDTLDWKYHNSNKIAKRVINKVKNGDIILMHDIYSATKNSLEIIIPKLLNDGYSFVTVSDLLYYRSS